MELITSSEVETLDLAQKIAQKLKPGSVLALSGELGAGKTTFTKGLVKSLGSSDRVLSPTFTILREYSTSSDIVIQHFDLYRIEDPSQLRSISFSELVSDPSAISIIEWPEIVKPLLPTHTILLEFRVIDDHKRNISITGL